jgi:lysophospholipase L1-like esterase
MLTARHIKIIEVHTNRDMPTEFLQSDHLHLTPEGHRLLASRLLPSVMQALGRPR